MKIIGYMKSDFIGKDDNMVRGYNVFLTYELGENGEGIGCQRIYVTDAKLEKFGYTLNVGDEVELTYNRFRKVSGIIPVNT